MEDKKISPKQPKTPKFTIKGLLVDYSMLEKKTIPEGRKIRKQLRKLGYYLSQEKKAKKAKSKKVKKVKNTETVTE